MLPLRASVFIPFLSTSCWYYLLGSYLEVSCTYKAQCQAYLLLATMVLLCWYRRNNGKRIKRHARYALCLPMWQVVQPQISRENCHSGLIWTPCFYWGWQHFGMPSYPIRTYINDLPCHCILHHHSYPTSVHKARGRGHSRSATFHF